MNRPIIDKIPRVSVVMSAYNAAHDIVHAIDGILGQTWTDFELIVVDDGSKDDTYSILERYQKSDGRIRLIRQENSGLTAALIRGCSEARGEYIARHDADDWSSPNRLSVQVALLDDNPKAGLVSCTTEYVGPNGEPLEPIIRCDDPEEATRQLLDEREGPPAHGSVMFRRSVYESVGGYRSQFYFAQDSDLWMRMAERSLIVYSSQLLYFWCRDPHGISGRMAPFQQQFGQWGQECRSARREGKTEHQILEKAQRLTDELRQNRHNLISFSGVATTSYLIGAALARRGDIQARSYFWQAIRTNPMHWRSWLRLMVPPVFFTRRTKRDLLKTL